jgi:hypothetical protein
MADVSDRLTLAEYISRPELLPLVQKDSSGGYKVLLIQFLPIGFWLFGKGAIFGRVRRDKLDVVAEMFVGLEAIIKLFSFHNFPEEAANRPQWIYEYLRKVADDGLRFYRDRQRKEPDSLLDLWLTSFAPPEYDFRKVMNVIELEKMKIRLGWALRQLDEWFLVGISLGANFPELTERLWRQYYERVDQESWTRARKAGVHLPKKSTPVPLEVVENEVLGEVTSYTTEYFPDLVDMLNLKLQ